MLKILDLESYKYNLKSGAIEDIFYDCDYLRANNFAENGETYIASFEASGGEIIYPFVLREIPTTIGGNSCFDIITPFEYGGPIIIEKKSDTLVGEFISEFEEYCRSNNIISEFIRFNPVIEHQSLFFEYYSCSLSKKNIIVKLDKSEDEIFSNYSKSNRRNIRLAEKRGVNVELVENNFENVNIFKDIYFSTMDRRNAMGQYYFNDQYFERISNIGDEKFSLFIAFENQNPISAAMFIHGIYTTHYHLSGTLKAFRNLYPNNLLLHTSIISSKNMGKKFFHLGGAASSQEELYQFKSRYSNERTDYYVGKKIHLEQKYNELVKQRENEVPNFEMNSNYFPLYRM